ncbi:unnamed protein product [Rhizophagus irregularis]|nr:unnamed protein product [Rhizophagus irregularis]CAB4436893.1 unnamed protein product [Rhizophagus irregularis]
MSSTTQQSQLSQGTQQSQISFNSLEEFFKYEKELPTFDKAVLENFFIFEVTISDNNDKVLHLTIIYIN